MKQRIIWVDVLKFIGISMVLCIHWENCPSLIANFINPFFLILFYFASGYCYVHKDSFKKFIYKKIRTLFVPWIVFSNINILLSHIYSIGEHNSLLKELKMNLLQVRGCGDQQWFLASLFLAFIPFYFVIKNVEDKKIKKHVALILIAILSLIPLYIKGIQQNISFCYSWGNTNLPWHLERIFESVMFMYLGYLYRTDYEEILEKRINKYYTFVVFFVYLLLNYVLNNNDSVILTNIIFSEITKLCGVVLFVMIAKQIKENRFILFIGQHTLIIFCIQRKFETALQVLFALIVPNFYYFVSNNEVLGSFFSIFFVLLNLFVLIIPVIAVENLFPIVFGRKPSTNMKQLFNK